jgi:hypothetical protein
MPPTIDIFQDSSDVLGASQHITSKPIAGKSAPIEFDAENAHPNQFCKFGAQVGKATKPGEQAAKGEAFVKGSDWSQWYQQEFQGDLPAKGTADSGGSTAEPNALEEDTRHKSIVPREWDTWYADTFKEGGSSVESEGVVEELEGMQQIQEDELEDVEDEELEDAELAAIDAAMEGKLAIGDSEVDARPGNPHAHEFMEDEDVEIEEPDAIVSFTQDKPILGDETNVVAPRPQKKSKPLTEPTSPALQTSKRAAIGKGSSAFNTVGSSAVQKKKDSLQFKAKPAPDFSQTAAPVCMRSDQLTIPRSPKFSTTSRKRGSSVMSKEEQDLHEMNTNQFKARTINQGVNTRSKRRKGPAHAKKLTTPKEPSFSTTSRRRASSVMSKEEQDLHEMNTNQFKARPIGAGTFNKKKRKPINTQPQKVLTQPVAPSFSTASRKRASSVMSKEEQDLHEMNTNQFKARTINQGVSTRMSNTQPQKVLTQPVAPSFSTASRKRASSVMGKEEQDLLEMQKQHKARSIGEGVNTRARSTRSAPIQRELTVTQAPKLSTSSRRRAASVLSAEQQDDLYMQTHQFKARPAPR